MSNASIANPANVLRALTRDGIALPVINVTDPRFRVADDEASLRALFARAHEEQRRNSRLPSFVMRFMLRRMAKQSLLVKALFGDGEAPFLDGISTYVMKLGADNLPPPFDSPMDKRMAASAHLALLRLRTQRVAHLLADALEPALAAAPGAPLALVDIAGGPAIDAVNALILLRRRDPALLARPVAVHVLDGDEAGPFFGNNALAALMGDGAPLAGLDIEFDHRSYDWNDTAPLASLLSELNAGGATIAASSEGGLFEYGSDDAIVANLAALLAGGVRIVAGSVTASHEGRRRLTTPSRIKVIPRGLDGFAPLAARGGWRVASAESAELSHVVLLEPA
jgi:hypothetical protein